MCASGNALQGRDPQVGVVSSLRGHVKLTLFYRSGRRFRLLSHVGPNPISRDRASVRDVGLPASLLVFAKGGRRLSQLTETIGRLIGRVPYSGRHRVPMGGLLRVI